MSLETTPKQLNSENKKIRKPRKGKTQAIIAGLVLVIIGSIIAGSFEKSTLTNYAGFGMLLVGIAAFVVGSCSMASANIENRLRRDLPSMCSEGRRPPICVSIWLIGVGIILGVIGSILANTYARESIINMTGFGMLLVGIGIFMVGLSGTALGTVRIELNQNKKTGANVVIPKIMFFDIVSIGIGVILLVIGSILAGSFEKESLLNYSGFSILIVGIALLCLGASGTVIAILKFRLNLDKLEHDEVKPGKILGSVCFVFLHHLPQESCSITSRRSREPRYRSSPTTWTRAAPASSSAPVGKRRRWGCAMPTSNRRNI